jgi:hypothetical protein
LKFQVRYYFEQAPAQNSRIATHVKTAAAPDLSPSPPASTWEQAFLAVQNTATLQPNSEFVFRKVSQIELQLHRLVLVSPHGRPKNGVSYMRNALMACLAAAAVIVAGSTTADAQRGHRMGGGPGIGGGGPKMGGHMGGPRMGGIHHGGRIHGGGAVRYSGIHGGRHFHRHDHFHGRRFFGPALAFGVGYPYYSYAYAEPACEVIRVHRVRPSGRVVVRFIERCY